MISKIKSYLAKRALARNPVDYVRSIGVKVGDNCRLLGVTPESFGSEPYLIEIGNHVSITRSLFVTHDGGVWVFRDKYPKIDKFGPIVVGNNVFIGIGCIILPGVTIGDNCIVGAGSVVSKSIPSGFVAAGIPAKPIKTIDEYFEKIQDQLMETKGMSGEDKRKYLIEAFRKQSE